MSAGNAKRKYPDADDMDVDKQGAQPADSSTGVGGGTSTVGPAGGSHISPSDTYCPTNTGFTFKRMFNQYITNTPKTVGLDKSGATSPGYIYWNWFRVPIDDLRFYLTPRTTDYIINSGSEFKIN